jgi:hypothetical protein
MEYRIHDSLIELLRVGGNWRRTEAALLRFRGEPTHKSVAIPKLNVVALNKLFGRFDGGGIVRGIVQKFGSNGIESPVDADDVGALIWHGAAPLH